MAFKQKILSNEWTTQFQFDELGLLQEISHWIVLDFGVKSRKKEEKEERETERAKEMVNAVLENMKKRN